MVSFLKKITSHLVIEMYDKATAEVDAAEIEKGILLFKRMNENLKSRKPFGNCFLYTNKYENITCTC